MSNGRPPPAQRNGKLRLRSTPRAFWRVPAATPSGFAVRTSQSCTPAGGGVRRSRAHDGVAGGLVAVDRADDEHAHRRGRVADAPHAQRPPFGRAAERRGRRRAAFGRRRDAAGARRTGQPEGDQECQEKFPHDCRKLLAGAAFKPVGALPNRRPAGWMAGRPPLSLDTG